MLLSVIIPTKNGQYTCLFAIESVLRINNDNFEVIIQDCSDTDILGKQINEKFGNDKRIKYYYSDSNPSMTENWNMAFSHAGGDYLCGIGDDDAVLPEIYEIATWAQGRAEDAVVQNLTYTYSWPGFYNQPFKGSFHMSNDFTGKFTVITDLNDRIKNFGTLRQPMAYVDFPSVYHALISKRLIKLLSEDTGKIFDSTSFDVYTAVAFSKYINEYVQVDYPFSIKGASAKSNSQRMYTKKSQEHFAEFKNLRLPELIPPSVGLYTTVAESYIVACKNTSREELIKLIDLPALYANISADMSEANRFCKEKLNQFAGSSEEETRFNEILKKAKATKRMYKRRGAVTGFIKKYIPFVFRTYIKYSSNKKKYTSAADILKGLQMHEHYIRARNIKFNP